MDIDVSNGPLTGITVVDMALAVRGPARGGVPLGHGRRCGEGRATGRRAESLRPSPGVHSLGRRNGHAVRGHEPRQAGYFGRRSHRPWAQRAAQARRGRGRVRDQLPQRGAGANAPWFQRVVSIESSTGVRPGFGVRATRARTPTRRCSMAPLRPAAGSPRFPAPPTDHRCHLAPPWPIIRARCSWRWA